MKQLAFILVIKLFLFDNALSQNWCDTTVTSSKTIALLKPGFKKAVIVDPVIEKFLIDVRLAADSSVGDIDKSLFKSVENVYYSFPQKDLASVLNKNMAEKAKTSTGIWKDRGPGQHGSGEHLMDIPDSLGYVIRNTDTLLLSTRSEWDCSTVLRKMLDKGKFCVYDHKNKTHFPFVIRKEVSIRCGPEGKKCICDGGGTALMYYACDQKGNKLLIAYIWLLAGK